MAGAGRASGAGGGQRWLVVGLIVTVLVLVIDASIKSASPTPARQLAARAWLESALPIVGRSDVQGADLAGVRAATAGRLGADRLSAELTAMTTGAAAAYRQLQALAAPATLQRPAALLTTCLWVRSQAAADISSAVDATLQSSGSSSRGSRSGGSSSGGAAQRGAERWAAAAQQLEVADQAYRLFTLELPSSLGVGVPTSTWVPAAGLYSVTDLEVFLRALRSRTTLTPVHLLNLVTVGTTPSPMGSTGPGRSVELLPPSSTLSVTAVVGNLGNGAEPALTVTASISGSDGPSSRRRSVSLPAGAVAAVTLSGLAPRLGPTITLTVSVTAPAGAPTRPVSRVIHFQMPAAPTSNTTTTRPAPTAASTTTATTTTP